jgi:hypothetical protein
VSAVTPAYLEQGRHHVLQDKQIPPYVTILRIHGPFLFGTTDQLREVTADLDRLERAAGVGSGDPRDRLARRSRPHDGDRHPPRAGRAGAAGVLGSALALNLICSIWPAARAARLDPSVALGHE